MFLFLFFKEEEQILKFEKCEDGETRIRLYAENTTALV